MGEQAPAVLAQVEGVEVDAPLDVVVGQVRLEEVVGVAVHVEDGATGRAWRGPADQRRDHRSLVVAAQIKSAA